MKMYCAVLTRMWTAVEQTRTNAVFDLKLDFHTRKKIHSSFSIKHSKQIHCSSNEMQSIMLLFFCQSINTMSFKTKLSLFVAIKQEKVFYQ